MVLIESKQTYMNAKEETFFSFQFSLCKESGTFSTLCWETNCYYYFRGNNKRGCIWDNKLKNCNWMHPSNWSVLGKPIPISLLCFVSPPRPLLKTLLFFFSFPIINFGSGSEFSVAISSFSGAINLTRKFSRGSLCQKRGKLDEVIAKIFSSPLFLFFFFYENKRILAKWQNLRSHFSGKRRETEPLWLELGWIGLRPNFTKNLPKFIPIFVFNFILYINV